MATSYVREMYHDTVGYFVENVTGVDGSLHVNRNLLLEGKGDSLDLSVTTPDPVLVHVLAVIV
jgi:hypothetical protein